MSLEGFLECIVCVKMVAKGVRSRRHAGNYDTNEHLGQAV